MSKKNIVLILIITAIFSVMALSLWGKESETGNRTDATAIRFTDEAGNVISTKEESVDDITLVSMEVSETDPKDIIYTFTLEILPVETTDDSLSYVVLNSNAKVEELATPTPVNEEGEEVKVNRFHSYKVTFTKADRGITVIRFTYNQGGNPKLAYLKFAITETHSQDIPD